ncbi:MAG: hypothetical protein PSY14_10795 [bacterium]|nr:hypothetical protein [bacterium]
MRNYFPRFLIILAMFTLSSGSAFASDPPQLQGIWLNLQEDFETADDKYYVIATPSQYLGRNSKGRTNIYKVHAPQDILLYSFDWFAPQLMLKTGKMTDSRTGISFVKTSEENIEFYFDGKMVKRYTAEELAKANAQTASIRFWHFLGYRWINAANDIEGRQIYEIDIANLVISFDPVSGAIVSERKSPELLPENLKNMISGEKD